MHQVEVERTFFDRDVSFYYLAQSTIAHCSFVVTLNLTLNHQKLPAVPL